MRGDSCVESESTYEPRNAVATWVLLPVAVIAIGVEITTGVVVAQLALSQGASVLSLISALLGAAGPVVAILAWRSDRKTSTQRLHHLLRAELWGTIAAVIPLVVLLSWLNVLYVI